MVDRIPLSPPEIPALPNNLDRPLWSVMIPAYNCSKFLQDAMESVLQQDLGPNKMQIEVVDDCSTDADVEKLVKEIGNGRIGYFRQEANVGSLRNFETCIKRAKGYYVHLLHGDDRVRDGFYKELGDLYEKYPQAGAAFCAFNIIKENGESIGVSDKQSDKPCILENWLRRLTEEPRLQYVCMVVKREVYEKLGGFYLAFYGEDWEMWTRIAKHYEVAYTPKPLADYRIHFNSITARSFLTGANVRDIAKVIQKNISHLPAEEQRKAELKAKRYYAYDAVGKTISLWYRSKNKNAAKVQMKEALNLYSDINLRMNVISLRLLMLLPTRWLPAIRKILGKDS